MTAVPGTIPTPDPVPGPILRPIAPVPAPRVTVTLAGGRDIALAPGRSATVRVTLRNAGTGPATRVRVRTTGAGFTAVPATVNVGTLAAGGQRVVTVRVTRRARAGVRVVRVGVTGTGVPAVTVTRRLILPVPRVVVRLTGTQTMSLARGRSVVIRATVRNTGTAAARDVRLRVAGSGVGIAPANRSIGTIAPGRSRVVAVRVTRRSATGVASARFAVTRTGAGPVTAVRRFTLPARRRTVPSGGPGGLHGRAYVFADHPATIGVRQPTYHGYFFVNAGWVYRGFPTTGFPTCTRKTAVGAGDGCLPYTFDTRTRRLTIDGATHTMDAGNSGFTIGGDRYSWKPTIAAGARPSVYLKHVSVYGLYPNQVISTTYLTLTPSGEFALTGSTMGTTGAGAPVTTSWVKDPGERGTYRILAGGTIELSFADGKVERRTILVNGTGRNGNPPDPQADGVLLNTERYYMLDR